MKDRELLAIITAILLGSGDYEVLDLEKEDLADFVDVSRNILKAVEKSVKRGEDE